MLDIVFAVAIVLFFSVAIGYVHVQNGKFKPESESCRVRRTQIA